MKLAPQATPDTTGPTRPEIGPRELLEILAQLAGKDRAAVMRRRVRPETRFRAWGTTL